MNHTPLPSAIQAATAAHQARHNAWTLTLPVPLGNDPTPRPGDLRTVLGHLIVLTHPRHLHGRTLWQALLAHPYTEMATDDDRIVPQWRATPYPLVIHHRWPTYVLAAQIGHERHGHIDPHTIDQTGTTGTPSHGPLDARTPLLTQHLTILQHLQRPVLPCLLNLCDCPPTPSDHPHP